MLVLCSSMLILGLGSGVSAAFPVSKNPVRISSEKPADYGEDEKEIALLTLREWGSLQSLQVRVVLHVNNLPMTCQGLMKLMPWDRSDASTAVFIELSIYTRFMYW